ncbi:hypothetical protein STAFG_0006 [Streptomyces afghaniensis 772]|uniref:Uncharacterized protein n=1 Tax=Streptomyces afghaniensis 772 TaxID=1283301 RepID=S4MTR9_9ACTN|nr:hypothetical protein STAFG_0006 [Streptomyces afghaniensis 772]
MSNGELRGERTARGRTTFTWRTAEPMASYLATLAIGDFDISRSTARDGLPVYTAVDPVEKEASRAVLARIPEVLRWASGASARTLLRHRRDRRPRGRHRLRPGDPDAAPSSPAPPTSTLLVHEVRPPVGTATP